MPLNRLEIPKNISAEYALISCIISDPNILYNLPVKHEYFYKPELKEVCKAILHLFVENKPIDLIAIQEQLRLWSKLEEVGGETFLNTIQSSSYTLSHADNYLEIIKDAYTLRNIIDLGNACLETGFTPQISVGEAKNRVSELSSKVLEDQGLVKTFSLSDLAHEEWDNFHYRIENPEKSGIHTGFSDLDILTGGLQKSDLLVIGARPGMGKTSLALKILLNIATQGYASLLFSLEMSRQQLIQRLVSMKSGVNLTKVITGSSISQEEYDSITDSIKFIGNLPIFVEDNVSTDIYDISVKSRKLKLQHDIKVVAVDYIQLMTTDSENQTHEIGVISRGLKKLARELDITTIGISQLNRLVEMRSDKRPILSDLRQSGDLEQDADKVLFIYREELYNYKPENAGLSEIILAKHRNGPIGNFSLLYKSTCTDFRDFGRTG